MGERKEKGEKVLAEGFTLEDARQVLEERKSKSGEAGLDVDLLDAKPTSIRQGKSAVTVKPHKVKRSAVSVLDILGFNPQQGNGKSTFPKIPDNKPAVDTKFKRYYDKLMRMREELSDRLQQRTSENLRYASLEDKTPAHILGQHTADGASEQADLELAMSFVENEQELLSEIDSALERIKNGTYGICERTGAPIDKKRLDALPFTRYSLVGQQELEKAGVTRRASRQEGPLFLYNDEDVPFGGGPNDEE